MPGRRARCPILEELRAATGDERRSVEFLERHRWADEPACPRCGVLDVYQMRTASGERNPYFRWRCRGCKKMFTVRTGTVFEESRLPLRVWVFAFWKACASKKGISALQLSREMEITHKSALFVLRRIRYGLGEGADKSLFRGTVEVDETYVGGKPRIKGISKRGRGTSKTPVVAVVERGGGVRFQVMPRITAKNLETAIVANVDTDSRLITDELHAYRRAGKAFKGGHHTVKHGAGEYARGDVHSNTVESVFSLLQRGIIGTFHSVSVKHLPNYLDEFAFRYDTRKLDDGPRVQQAIR